MGPTLYSRVQETLAELSAFSWNVLAFCTTTIIITINYTDVRDTSAEETAEERVEA
jgi:hypothetical protein